MANKKNQATDELTHEEYTKAMNFIGQHLLAALAQSVEKLPQPLRKYKVVSQALSAFLANVIYKQFPEDAQAREEMHADLTELLSIQLGTLSKAAESIQ